MRKSGLVRQQRTGHASLHLLLSTRLGDVKGDPLDYPRVGTEGVIERYLTSTVNDWMGERSNADLNIHQSYHGESDKCMKKVAQVISRT